MPMSSIEFVVCCDFEKTFGDIVKGDRDNNEEIYTRKFGFEVLGHNIKVFYKQG